MAEGWSAPLTNFMDDKQLLECLHFKTLTVDGKRQLQSVPITCAVSDEVAQEHSQAKSITLTDDQGTAYAVLHNPVFFPNRKEEILTRLFGTWSKQHPMAERMLTHGD